MLVYWPVLVLLPLLLAPPLNHDVAAVLEFSQRWLAGEPLYSRLVDVNPPLIFVLNLLPAVLAKLTTVPAVVALQFCLIAFAATIWWLASRVRQGSPEGAIERLFLDAAALLIFVGAGFDLGQRDHLVILGALPYLFGAAQRADGGSPPYGYATAAIAAMAFALKPHFLIIPGLVELYILVARGPRAALRDPVPWIMAAIWASYVATVLLFFPDYLNVVLPLARNSYSKVGDVSFWWMLQVPRLTAALVVALPLAIVALLGRRTMSKVLSLAALGAIVAAIAQRKGWSYHIVPAELCACLLAGNMAARWLDTRVGPAKFRHAVAAVLAAPFLLVAMATGEVPWRELNYASGPAAAISDALRQTAGGQRALVLSPRVWPIYPALNYARVHTTMRSINLWMLQGAYGECLADGRRYRDAGEMDPVERFVFQSVSNDFAENPPAVVVIDRIPGILWCGKEFDLLVYFLRNPVFAATWSRYRFFGERDALLFYVRRD